MHDDFICFAAWSPAAYFSACAACAAKYLWTSQDHSAVWDAAAAAVSQMVVLLYNIVKLCNQHRTPRQNQPPAASIPVPLIRGYPIARVLPSELMSLSLGSARCGGNPGGLQSNSAYKRKARLCKDWPNVYRRWHAWRTLTARIVLTLSSCNVLLLWPVQWCWNVTLLYI